MSRIRSIKPEFFSSAQISECSRNARLLFIGMWCWCDDSGIHPSNSRQLKMEVFPGDDDLSTGDVRAMVDELVSQGLLVEYASGNTSFLRVTGWKHQKINRPQPPKYPTDGASVTRTKPPKISEQSPPHQVTISDHSLNTHDPFTTDPIRSDPIRSDLETQRESRPLRARDPTDRLFALSGDFEIPEGWVPMGQELRPDLSREEVYAAAEKFRSHHAELSHARKATGWDAEWRKWIANERAMPKSGSSGSRRFVVDGQAYFVPPNDRSGTRDNEHVTLAARLGISSRGLSREALEQKILGKLRQISGAAA